MPLLPRCLLLLVLTVAIGGGSASAQAPSDRSPPAGAVMAPAVSQPPAPDARAAGTADAAAASDAADADTAPAAVPAASPERPNAAATAGAVAATVAPPPRLLTLDRALTALGEAAFEAEPDAATARAVRLPDEWALSRPGFGGSVRYRLRFDSPPPPAPGDMLALYLPRVCSRADVRLNGQLLHAGGRGVDAPTHDCNQPLIVNLPAALLRDGGDANVLDLAVTGHALGESGSRLRAGALGPLQIGPLSVLAPQQALHQALQVALPQALGATLLLMGGFMFVLGFVNRRDSHLAYFGAVSVGWALVNVRGWLRLGPWHAHAEFLIVALWGFIVWAAVQFLLRYGGTRSRLADIGLPLQCVLVVLSLLLAGPDRLHAVSEAWTVVLGLEMGAATLWYLRRSEGQRSRWIMGTLLTLAAGAAGVEAAVQAGAAPPLAAYLAALVVPAILALAGLRLVQQQGRALHHAEQDRAQLEQRVREASTEIERNYRQMAELRVEQITERERKRIAADLHDDLGAKLLTIVHTSDNERISTLAREALEEMRLSVRGLTGRPVRLTDALGDWRAEVVARLAQAGIDGEWNAPDELPQMLSARGYVQTTRILREATSNIIKHSQAGHATVTAAVADGDFQLVIRDDGQGIGNEIDARLDRGHGLASMKNRAKQLHGQCLVESAHGFGTVIRLTVPLEGTAEPS